MSEPSGSTGVQPSAEAIEVLAKSMAVDVPVHDWHRKRAVRALIVAYAIDTPAIHAAGVAEGREVERKAIVEWLREGARDAKDWADAAGSRRLSRLAEAIEAARFPSEGTI